MERLIVTDHGYRYQNVETWLSRVNDLYGLDMIFFPINISRVHWTLAIAFIKDKTIRYYDSMSGDGTLYMDAIERWFSDEARRRDLPTIAWSRICTPCPQQTNGCDCGVFVVVAAVNVFQGRELTYTQADMAEYRMKLGMDILRGTLHYLLQPRLLPINSAVRLPDGSFHMARKNELRVSDVPAVPPARVVSRNNRITTGVRYFPPPSSSNRGSRHWPEAGAQPFLPHDFPGRPVIALGLSTVSSLFSRTARQSRIRLGEWPRPVPGTKIQPPDSLHVCRKKIGRKRLLKGDPVLATKVFSHKHVPIQFQKNFEDWDRQCFPGDDFGVVLEKEVSNIKVATLNVGGINGDKLLFVAWYFRRLEIDVLFLQDTRASVVDSIYHHRDLKDLLGRVYVSSTGTALTGQFTKIGGQTVIVSEKWARHVPRFKADDSGMGVVADKLKYLLRFRVIYQSLTT